MHLILTISGTANRALADDVGLIATFGGLGVVVNVLLVYIAIQVRGEHRQNREYRSAATRTGTGTGV
ncbi:MAG: hypothetical protein ACYDA6_05010 [Solirubrobacteraceae bacterium]